MQEIAIHPYRPGVLKEVVRLHAAYYGEHWGFDQRFEDQVFRELSVFVDELNPQRDGFWWAEAKGGFAGAVAVDGSRYGTGQARVRWFIVDGAIQGRGIGSRLLDRAMEFCRDRKFAVHLWTFAGLDAARVLYERHGFRLVEEAVSDGWGAPITEQKFILTSPAPFSRT